MTGRTVDGKGESPEPGDSPQGVQSVEMMNNLAEQQMKRIALLRKNALFVGTARGGETAAVISTLTSTCQRHEINPQTYLTQLLAGLQSTPVSQLETWLPDQWKAAQDAESADPN
jgi:hypothetical protein